MRSFAPALLVSLVTAVRALKPCTAEDGWAGCACEHTACTVVRERGVRAIKVTHKTSNTSGLWHYYDSNGRLASEKAGHTQHECKFHQAANQCRCICGEGLASSHHRAWLKRPDVVTGVQMFWSQEQEIRLKILALVFTQNMEMGE